MTECALCDLTPFFCWFIVKYIFSDPKYRIYLSGQGLIFLVT